MSYQSNTLLVCVWLLLSMSCGHEMREKRQAEAVAFRDIVQQRSSGNRQTQCPCVVHPASGQCIVYDSRFLAVNIEEAMLAFLDLSEAVTDAPIINGQTFQCNSPQCRNCFSILFYRFQAIGLINPGYQTTTQVLTQNQINAELCTRLNYIKPDAPIPSPPSPTPAYLAALIAEGSARLTQPGTNGGSNRNNDNNNNNGQGGGGNGRNNNINQQGNQNSMGQNGGRPNQGRFPSESRVGGRNNQINLNSRINNNNRQLNNQFRPQQFRPQQQQFNQNSNQQFQNQQQQFQQQFRPQQPQQQMGGNQGFSQNGQWNAQINPQLTNNIGQAASQAINWGSQLLNRQPPWSPHPIPPGGGNNGGGFPGGGFPGGGFPGGGFPGGGGGLPGHPGHEHSGESGEHGDERGGNRRLPNLGGGSFPTIPVAGRPISPVLGNGWGGNGGQGNGWGQGIGGGQGHGGGPMMGGGGGFGGGLGGGNTMGGGMMGQGQGNGQQGGTFGMGSGGLGGIGGFGGRVSRGKRAAHELGTRFDIHCYDRGESPDDHGMLSLCGTCWSIRKLPDDYFPHFINERSCNSDDYCLSGWGTCVPSYRPVEVVRRVNGRYIPVTVNSVQCCDCKVQPGTNIHSLVIGP